MTWANGPSKIASSRRGRVRAKTGELSIATPAIPFRLTPWAIVRKICEEVLKIFVLDCVEIRITLNEMRNLLKYWA